MKNMINIKYDFDDLLIEPAIYSDMDKYNNSRQQFSIKDENNMLPLFTAPMDTVVDLSNSDKFIKNGIITILPRTVKMTDYSLNNKNQWFSYSLTEFENLFLIEDENQDHNINVLKHDIQLKLKTEKIYALIDIANGHILKLEHVVKLTKEKYGDKIILMVGNVANPETYRNLSIAGADYIRIGIGNGGGCLTTQQLGIGYPMASLIKECYDISCQLDKPSKIVADGGFQKYSDIIKGLGLGADYIMIGSIFNKCLESCADTYLENQNHGNWKTPGQKVDQYDEKVNIQFSFGTKFYKLFRGMSTKEAQLAMGKTDLKTSEGIVKLNPVEYTLNGWVDNFESYLKSAMSYTNKTNLKNFIGNVYFNFITQNALNRFRK